MSPRELVQFLFGLYYFLILIRILMSWLPMAGIQIDPYNPIVQFLIRATDPVLEPFRRLIPPIGGMDLSPIIAILVLQVVGEVVAAMMPG